MNPVTWLDIVLVLMVAGTTALGAKRRLVGLMVGVGGVLLLRPLLVVGSQDPWVALAAALVGGLLLTLIGQRLVSPALRQGWPSMVLGGFGGLLLGSALLVAIVVSLPIERAPANQNAIIYPPSNAPLGLSEMLKRSPTVRLGRAILLYPLLEEPEAEFERTLYQGLRGWFVVGEPWN